MASLLALDVVRDCTRKVRFDSAPQRGIFLTISLKAFGLLWLIVFAACGGGSASAPSCTEGQTCTPTTACHGGTISCASGAPVCVDSGVAPDGTACSSGGSCQTGVCRRTVSGAFQTTYWTDAGIRRSCGDAIRDPRSRWERERIHQAASGPERGSKLRRFGCTDRSLLPRARRDLHRGRRMRGAIDHRTLVRAHHQYARPRERHCRPA